MPLKLSLKPGETFVVNGAVVRNGDRRGVLLLETQARVLREKDILRPADAVTPAGRAYFAVMQMYLLGEGTGRSIRRPPMRWQASWPRCRTRMTRFCRFRRMWWRATSTVLSADAGN